MVSGHSWAGRFTPYPFPVARPFPWFSEGRETAASRTFSPGLRGYFRLPLLRDSRSTPDLKTECRRGLVDAEKSPPVGRYPWQTHGR